MTRHQETIVFLDPFETDVDEWIRFFEAQKQKYREICKREENERQRELGRCFTQKERSEFRE